MALTILTVSHKSMYLTINGESSYWKKMPGIPDSPDVIEITLLCLHINKAILHKFSSKIINNINLLRYFQDACTRWSISTTRTILF
ncbi:hypothetical protein QE152_g36770 [Popillia japonica]|uniref:Uncharacterized protein n=1 Tax=Popillia japonica TaxID=7064 RepID=A0AAW1ICU4_POPJA